MNEILQMEWQNFLLNAVTLIFTIIIGILAWSLKRNVKIQDDKIEMLENDMKDVKDSNILRFDEIKDLLNSRTSEIKELISCENKNNTERIHANENRIIELRGQVNNIDTMLKNIIDMFKEHKSKEHR